ncbi:MAG: glycosyltransferase [bacterium]
MSGRTYSVIVPTRDRHAVLSLCLDRLAPGSQELAQARYEVIVTDDSPTESARELVTTRYPWARWMAGPRRGPAANRNRAAAATTAEYLVFVDDDCVPERELLSGYDGVERDGIDVYEGRITCKDGIASPRQTAPLNLEGGALWSCNFAIRRSAFKAVGGFDERFPIAHMEDVDLRERLRTAGFHVQFVPGASVDHPPRRLPWGASLAQQHRAGMLYMVLHPPVRGLAWYLQNTLRARLSRVRRLPKSFDSLLELGSVLVELTAIAWNWSRWKRWARSLAAGGRP